jgi:hypothetical protein
VSERRKLAEFSISTEIRPHEAESFLVVVSRRRTDRPRDAAQQLGLAHSLEHAERLGHELSAKMEKSLRKGGHRLAAPLIGLGESLSLPFPH